MKKNLNIVDYIIENKKLNQRAISKELEISQAQISKWKTGVKIPEVRELQLIELAGLNNICEEFTINNADSKWAILTRKYCDGQRWFEYLEALVYKNQILNLRENDVLGGDELKSWMKDFMFLLNEGDVGLPEAPYKADPGMYENGDDLGFHTSFNPFFDSIRIIFQNIKTLQEQIVLGVPGEYFDNKCYFKLLDLIPSTAINKRLRFESERYGPTGMAPLITDIFDSFRFQNKYTKKIDALLEEFELKVSSFNIEFDWKNLSRLMCGAEYIHQKNKFAQRHAIKQEAKRLIIASNKSNETQVENENENENENLKNVETLSNQSVDFDTDGSEKYLSLAERKITNQLKKQEKEIKELHSKVDSLISLLSITKPTT